MTSIARRVLHRVCVGAATAGFASAMVLTAPVPADAQPQTDYVCDAVQITFDGMPAQGLNNCVRTNTRVPEAGFIEVEEWTMSGRTAGPVVLCSPGGFELPIPGVPTITGTAELPAGVTGNSCSVHRP